MAKFLALTSRGLEPAVEAELLELGLKGLKREGPGVLFESNWAGCYRANYGLRSATRVILPILDFPAYQPEDLYHNLRKHDFTKYIDPNQTLTVDSSVRESKVFRDQRFAALKAKDAVVDQFREKFGVRPSVDNDNPDLRLLVRVVGTEVAVAIDTSGETLSQRGYRLKSVMAPLREHLAAGLLQLADWQPGTPLIDPMCGSGTLLIEAALREKGVPAGFKRKSFGFERLKGFQSESWEHVKAEWKTPASKVGRVRFFGFDKSPEAIRAAKLNARAAGVEGLIEFQIREIAKLRRPVESGLLIVNPPYGERLSTPESIAKLYQELGTTLKKEFTGWDCWLLSGQEEATKALHLKATRRIRVFNGPLDCRFLKYELYEGSPPI